MMQSGRTEGEGTRLKEPDFGADITDDQIRILIRDRLILALQPDNLKLLQDDTITKIAGAKKPLYEIESNIADLNELAAKYDNPPKDDIKITLQDGRKAEISTRMKPGSLAESWNIRMSDELNFRQRTLLNAALFEATSPIVLRLMNLNPRGTGQNERVMRLSAGILANINFNEIGMANPMEFTPNKRVTDALKEVDLTKKMARSSSMESLNMEDSRRTQPRKPASAPPPSSIYDQREAQKKSSPEDILVKKKIEIRILKDRIKVATGDEKVKLKAELETKEKALTLYQSNSGVGLFGKISSSITASKQAKKGEREDAAAEETKKPK